MEYLIEADRVKAEALVQALGSRSDKLSEYFRAILDDLSSLSLDEFRAGEIEYNFKVNYFRLFQLFTDRFELI